MFGCGCPSTNTISFLTIATWGDAKDFGDLNRTTADAGAAASPTRYTIFGGSSSNEIAYVQIATLGNSIDFGNLTQSISETGGLSNGHGGLR